MKQILCRCNSYNSTEKDESGAIFAAEYCKTRFSPMILVFTHFFLIFQYLPVLQLNLGWATCLPRGLPSRGGSSAVGLQPRGRAKFRAIAKYSSDLPTLVPEHWGEYVHRLQLVAQPGCVVHLPLPATGGWPQNNIALMAN